MARSLPYAAVLGLATLCYVALGVVLPGLPPHVTGELGQERSRSASRSARSRSAASSCGRWAGAWPTGGEPGRW